MTTARHRQGKRWMARWVDHDGLERTKAFDRKADAERHRVEVTTQLTTGTYADPRRGAVTFGTIAEPWFDSKSGLKAKTRAGYRSLLDVVVLPRWGETPLRDITHADVQSWVHRLATDPDARQRKASKQPAEDDHKGLSAARVVQAYQVLDQVLRFAVRARYISLNPAADVQLPRKMVPEKTPLTHEQVRQIADAAGDLRTAVYVLGYGGLRYGELAALRVGDVDARRRRLKVSRSVTDVAKMGMVEGTTKTHQTRSVPLPAFVMDLVAQQIKGRSPDKLVFPHNDGSWIPRDWFALRLDKASSTVGLVGVTPHVLRHTAGSLAVASGASVVTVQKLLGHQSPITTMNAYAHQLPDDFDNLAAAMDTAARAAAVK
ncbi:tyrosine-type recombinase/integrase [Mycobacterium deserti]|uniref:Site-specific integrase n=1 Tax=Mycobacterium deserti TaxID=2978347 RepID=A0ABT2M5V2_9MYCO|nr:site-specific integrase [Mycobacterium deserti]MCT7657628.1 site-specific integrase [Mycobacterium deserti]